MCLCLCVCVGGGGWGLRVDEGGGRKAGREERRTGTAVVLSGANRKGEGEGQDPRGGKGGVEGKGKRDE